MNGKNFYAFITLIVYTLHYAMGLLFYANGILNYSKDFNVIYTYHWLILWLITKHK